MKAFKNLNIDKEKKYINFSLILELSKKEITFLVYQNEAWFTC